MAFDFVTKKKKKKETIEAFVRNKKPSMLPLVRAFSHFILREGMTRIRDLFGTKEHKKAF